MRHQLGLRRHSTHCYTHGTDTPWHRPGWTGQRSQWQSRCCWSLCATSCGPPDRQDFARGSIATVVQELRGVSEARREATAAPAPGVMGWQLPGAGSPTHGFVHTLSPSSGTWCSAGAGPRGPAQGTSRRHRASTAPLGPWATPPMTKSRLGARQLEQEQRPVGMGGSGSHFFRERLNPSAEPSGQDWFPVGDGLASAPPQPSANPRHCPSPYACL